MEAVLLQHAPQAVLKRWSACWRLQAAARAAAWRTPQRSANLQQPGCASWYDVMHDCPHALQAALKRLLTAASGGNGGSAALATARVAVRCLVGLLISLPHFNYAGDLLRVRGCPSLRGLHSER